VQLVFDVGPIDSGHELVTRLTSNIASAGTGKPVLYTDDNALEFVKRTTNLAQVEPIPSSYYPIAASAFIKDEGAPTIGAQRQLTLLTSRAHGATSLAAGELEVMMHRRCDSNDGKGNPEDMNPTDHISVSMLLLLDDVQGALSNLRRLSLLQNFPPTAVFAPTASAAAYTAVSKTSASLLLAQELPPNVHLLSLDQRYGEHNATVLRLQHVFEAGDHPILSLPATVDLDQVLNLNFRLESVIEMSLSANLRKASEEQARLKWRVVNDSADPRYVAAGGDDGHKVTLTARQIRTFLLNAQPLDPATDGL
jgi:hypothetical protein